MIAQILVGNQWSFSDTGSDYQLPRAEHSPDQGGCTHQFGYKNILLSKNGIYEKRIGIRVECLA